MKNKILVNAAIAGLLLLSGCKNKTAEDADNKGTAIDTVQQTTSHATAGAKATGDLMADMNEMMDKVHALEKKGIADYDLAAELREHHKGAIAMSETQLDSGIDAQLKEMAQKIMDAQQKEVDQIDKMLDGYDDKAKDYDPMNTDSGLGKAMMDNMQAMMKMPEMDAVSVDKSFATMMIKHHQDGIKMGKTIQQYAKDTKFKQMAQKMISDQQKEIEALQNWLTQHK
ncbi:DUF305 domain-containing protein [Flavobacterium sp. J372]|jgi:uncharacterized protein (DUF305 family)|uniref:DUF305 domain-containing protein n=1 Tax=Flavobacterium sp. J372 TaxID=2898436 RepID=UPI0021519154|nr:DUF305 domain-containing protein [Flavobacterium sp. J372]MCR5863391.1 DUF305 domain-containing protein [Flavobacterium sp. J372]